MRGRELGPRLRAARSRPIGAADVAGQRAKRIERLQRDARIRRSRDAVANAVSTSAGTRVAPIADGPAENVGSAGNRGFAPRRESRRACLRHDLLGQKDIQLRGNRFELDLVVGIE